MNRVKKAWLALTGRLEPEVREVVRDREVFVPVGDAITDVFVALYRHHFPFSGPFPDWAGRVYLSCAQAFAECGPDADVRPMKAWVVGNDAYLLGGVEKKALQPKPKRAKGR